MKEEETKSKTCLWCGRRYVCECVASACIGDWCKTTKRAAETGHLRFFCSWKEHQTKSFFSRLHLSFLITSLFRSNLEILTMIKEGNCKNLLLAKRVMWRTWPKLDSFLFFFAMRCVAVRWLLVSIIWCAQCLCTQIYSWVLDIRFVNTMAVMVWPLRRHHSVSHTFSTE